MRQSKLFYKTEKASQKEGEAVSHSLLTRAGFVDQLAAGIYSFMPLGFIVLKKIEKIIREEMLKSPIDGQEVLMPDLIPKENWQQVGWWENFDTLFKLKGGNEKEYGLGATHEAVVTPLSKKAIFSYKDLPLYLFQIQTKFRNELRAKSGLLRTREFIMKDLYSFHTSQDDLDNYYAKMEKAYERIYKRCGIGKFTYKTWASGGAFSKYSHEYQTLTEAGEDIIYICKNCGCAINREIKRETTQCLNCEKGVDFEEKKAVEVGNIFKLGTKYSQPFDLKYRDKEGKENLVIMGCYGIGLPRLLAASVEINHDERGIIWPNEIAPFDIHLIQLDAKKDAEKIYKDCLNSSISVLYDDRMEATAGEKFAESDLIGIPIRIVVSKRTLEKKSVEVKKRNSKKAELVKIKDLIKYYGKQGLK